MQVAPSSDGIQKLLAAETEASKIVAEARKGLFEVLWRAVRASKTEKHTAPLLTRSVCDRHNTSIDKQASRSACGRPRRRRRRR